MSVEIANDQHTPACCWSLIGPSIPSARKSTPVANQVTAPKDEKGQTYYNYAMVEFPSEERPGASVFYRDQAGDIFHTYSTYARGLDILLPAYNFLDLTAKGRDEAEMKPHAMAWVRHHDRYENTRDAKKHGCCPE